MDELELISRLREEVPLGSADRAEHAFLYSIQGPGARPARRQGFLRRLRLLAPVVQARHGAPRLAHCWWLPGAPGSPSAGRPAMRRRRTAAVIVAAATATGLAAAGLTLLPGNTSLPVATAGASPAAARLLAKIAAAAARQPSPPVRDSQFLYIKGWDVGDQICNARRDGSSSCVTEKPFEQQAWYSVSNLCAGGLTRADGRTTTFSFSSRQFPCRGDVSDPTYRFLQTLPTEPHALFSLIEQQMLDPPGPEWVFFTIGIDATMAPSQVSAALFRAAALIPGVAVVPDAADAFGRPGVAVAVTFRGVRTELIFSKQTLQYLGERGFNIASGATIDERAILQRAIVDHAGQIPG